MLADYSRWAVKNGPKEAKETFEDAKRALMATFAQMPATAKEIPSADTPEGRRLASFKRVCPEEFCRKVDRLLLTNPEAFDQVCTWDGTYPGPLCVGPTGTRKTGSAWSTLGRLYVKHNFDFTYMPVRKLIVDTQRAEEGSDTAAYFGFLRQRRIIFVDDLDKFNPNFQSEPSALFSFYDWVYSNHVPVIATTNQTREWWEERMGSAFTRRLFADAHKVVQF